MAKRSSLRGLGARLFEPGAQSAGAPSHQDTSLPVHQHGPRYPKATFYLPASLIERLEQAWLERRRRGVKVKKSDLVRIALEAFLADSERRPR
jgi:hypothetical protein